MLPCYKMHIPDYIDWNFQYEEVISRANRMGATWPILVETLAMHGTIEKQTMKFLLVDFSVTRYFIIIMDLVITDVKIIL